METIERKEYQAFGKTYILPEINTVQYNEGMKIIEKNDLGLLTNENATKLLSIALVEKGSTAVVNGVTVTECWTPETGAANEKLFEFFPMKARIEALAIFFDGVNSSAALTNSVFASYAETKIP